MTTTLRYQLRPAKYIERQMIADALRRLDAIAPLDNYEYIGFGAIEFVDFKVFHRALGISDMISIEKDSGSPERYLFNCPYSTIQVHFGKASEVLPTIDWSGLKIVWLDYEQQLDKEVIRDCETVVRELRPGSILIATVNARPRESGKRASILKERVGEDRVPGGLSEADLSLKGLPVVQRRILTEAVEQVVKHRTGSAWLRQLFNFRYADDAQMQTIGWIVDTDTRAVDGCRFGEVPYLQEGDESFDIKVPVLTAKEVTHLNRRLPLRAGEKLAEPWLDSDDLQHYAGFYRWYPEILTLT